MYTKILLLATASLLASCDGASTSLTEHQQAIASYKSSFHENVDFVLPNKNSQRIIVQNPKDGFKSKIEFENFEYEPDDLELWISGNVWSDASTQISEVRANIDAGDIKTIREFLKLNNLSDKLKINFIQQDFFNEFTNKGQSQVVGNQAYSMPSPCSWSLSLCVDRFVVSPTERYSGNPKSMSTKEWASRFISWDDSNVDSLSVLKTMGFSDEKSKLWDFSPRMVFLVDDGEVVDAIIPFQETYLRQPNAIEIISMLSAHFKLDPASVILPEYDYKIRLAYTKYGKPTVDLAAQQLLDALSN